MQIQVQLPINVNVDNVGAIWLANNYSGEQTRHIDISTHFIKGFILDGVIDIVKLMSTHNDSDLCTKNLPSAAHHCLDYQRNESRMQPPKVQLEGC